jgi:acyl-CoA thioesterase YciA
MVGVETAPQGAPSLQTIAMPADTNANGDIFGGWLMAQMDLGCSIVARSRRGAGSRRWRSRR